MNVPYCSLCCCVSCWYSCSFSASLVWNKIKTNLALNLTTLKFNRELKAKLVYSAETELKKMLPLIPYAYFSDKGTLADPFPNMSRARTHTQHLSCSHSSILSLFFPSLLLMHSVTSHSFTAALGLRKYHTRIQKWEKNSDVSKS